MVNPRAKIYLQWTKVKNADPQKFFERNGITYISDRDMIMPDDASRNFGLYHYDQNGEVVNLAMPFYNWGAFYERILRSILEGNWKQEEKNETSNAISYWWGMSADVIDVICSENMPNGTRRLIEFLKNSIRAGSFHPFDGLIYAQDGSTKCTQGKSLNAEEIITMNWLAQNVVGYIPKIGEMNERAQELMQLQGIKATEQTEMENE